MTNQPFQPSLLVVSAVLAVMLGTASAQAQDTNTTFQEGRVCINRTFQYGDSNDNTTYQTCKVNINRTVQRGTENRNATAQFGRHNANETRQSRGFKHTGYISAPATHFTPEQHGAKRGWDHRTAARNPDK